MRLEDLDQGNEINCVGETKDSLVILLNYDYLHMIDFSKFDDYHSSHSG